MVRELTQPLRGCVRSPFLFEDGPGLDAVHIARSHRERSLKRHRQAEALVEARRAAVEINGLLLTGALNPAEVGTALQSQPGATQRRAVLNQLQQEGNSSRMLPAALQTGGGP